MYQLQQTLKDNNQRTINFNAWRQDKVESMWAAFALQLHQRANPQTNDSRKVIKDCINLILQNEIP